MQICASCCRVFLTSAASVCALCGRANMFLLILLLVCVPLLDAFPSAPTLSPNQLKQLVQHSLCHYRLTHYQQCQEVKASGTTTTSYDSCEQFNCSRPVYYGNKTQCPSPPTPKCFPINETCQCPSTTSESPVSSESPSTSPTTTPNDTNGTSTPSTSQIPDLANTWVWVVVSLSIVLLVVIVAVFAILFFYKRRTRVKRQSKRNKHKSKRTKKSKEDKPSTPVASPAATTQETEKVGQMNSEVVTRNVWVAMQVEDPIKSPDINTGLQVDPNHQQNIPGANNQDLQLDN